jgi:hypothetical protein
LTQVQKDRSQNFNKSETHAQLFTYLKHRAFHTIDTTTHPNWRDPAGRQGVTIRAACGTKGNNEPKGITFDSQQVAWFLNRNSRGSGQHGVDLDGGG